MKHYVIVGKENGELYLVKSSDEEIDGETRIERDKRRRVGIVGVWEIVDTELVKV